MKKRDDFCLTFALIAFLPNAILLQALSTKSFLFGKDSIVIAIGIIGFLICLISLYLSIPYFDDETNQKRPLTGKMISGIGLGSLNLIIVLVLTPTIFIYWGSSGLQKILSSIM